MKASTNSKDGFFHSIFDFFYLIVSACNNNKIKFYLFYFTLFLLMFQILNGKYTEIQFMNKFYEKKILYYCFLGGLLLLYFIYTAYEYSNVSDKLNQFRFIGVSIGLLCVLSFLLTPLFSILTEYIPQEVMKYQIYIFYIIHSLFFIIYASMFIMSINNYYNVEVLIALELLLFMTILNMINVFSNKDSTYERLNKSNLNFMTLNCFPEKASETYKNDRETSIQNTLIAKKYGPGYVELKDNIPVKYFNKKTNQFEDLVLCDFYYPGSYYSYLGDSPLLGNPNIEALQNALEKFKVRVITLDIYSSLEDNYDPKAEPVVRCENMAPNAQALKLEDCFALINKYAWLTNNGNTNSFPFMIVYQFHFEENEHLYRKIYNITMEYFSKYLINKKYGFSGRNGEIPVSEAPMSECLGKVVLVTNRYPTQSILDEVINATNDDSNQMFKLYNYKEEYVKFNDIGVSQDFSKNELVSLSKFNMSFFYTLPNKTYENKDQTKAGLFNPRFQDVAQYGVQGTLMYLFVPDNNLLDWHLFFKNKSNYDPILKDEKLRNIDLKPYTVQEQNPVVGLQKDQKYCLIPGFLSTEKSNLSGGNSNISCDEKISS